MRKVNIIVVILSSLFLVLSVILFSFSFKKEVKLITMKKAYSYVSKLEDDEEINVLVYSNILDSYVTDISSISSCHLLDKEKLDILPLKVTEIERLDEKQDVKDENYYRYVFKMLVDMKFETPYFFESSKTELILEYKQNEKIKLEIGSMSLYKVPSSKNDDLVITKLKGIVNNVGGRKTIVGIELGLRNMKKEEIDIVAISPLDVNLETSNSEIILMNDEEYLSSKDISLFLGYPYDYRNLIDGKVNIKLDDNKEKNYLIPFKNIGSYPVSKLGLSIEYMINDEMKTYFLDDFYYFTESYNMNEESPHIYVYGNN